MFCVALKTSLMIQWIIPALILLATSAFGSVDMAGVSVDTGALGGGDAVQSWADCSSLDAYYTMDEVGNGPRPSTLGNCTDCDLDISAGRNALTDHTAPYCRAGEVFNGLGGFRSDQGVFDYTSEMTIAGFFKSTGKTASGGDTSSFTGIAFGFWGGPLTPAPSIVARSIGDQVSSVCGVFWDTTYDVDIENCVGTEDYTFGAFTVLDNGDTTSDVNSYFGGSSRVDDRNAQWWIASYHLYGESLDLTSRYMHASYAHSVNSDVLLVDEISVWGVEMSEAEVCFLCSCRLNGESCKHVNGEYVTTGLNGKSCGGCTLPTLGSDGSLACPS